MKVSVVIPNYNGEKYLRDCIQSIKKQTYNNYEIIIIDNASQDSRYEWIKEYPEIIFKSLDKNYGFSKAVNEGIKISQGQYVLLLNNDTVLTAHFIQEMLEVMEKDCKIFGVSSKMLDYYQQDRIDDAGDEYTVLGWTYKRGDGKRIEECHREKRVFSACAGAALYRKDIFNEIGYFDEAFFAYMEDVDISYRANSYGYRNVYAPRAIVYHVGSATSGGRYNAFKVKLAARNNVYVPYKNMPLLQLIINIPFLLIGCIVKLLVFTLKGFGKEYIEGFLEGIKTLGQIKKVPFKIKNIPHYIYIEWLLILNIFKYGISKLK